MSHAAVERSDLELVESARTGDSSAFSAIYDRYADQAFSLALTLTRDREMAEDATADTFLIAWQRLDSLREPERLRSWLLAIVRNRVQRLGRASTNVRPIDPKDLPVSVEAESQPIIDPTASIALVWDAADGLNENERAVLELQTRQGLPPDEIAEILGVTRNNVNQIASRMRSNLEKSILATLLVRETDRGCSTLDEIIGGSGAVAMTPLLRKRIARHTGSCDRCDDSRSRRALAAFGESPASAAPDSIRISVVEAIATGGSIHPRIRLDADGFPRSSSRMWRVIGGSVAIVIVTVALIATSVSTLGTGMGGADGDTSAVSNPTDVDRGPSTDATAELASIGPAVDGEDRSSDADDGGSAVTDPATTSNSSTPATSTSVPSKMIVPAPKISSVEVSPSVIYARSSPLATSCRFGPSTSTISVTVTTPSAVGRLEGSLTDPSGRTTAIAFSPTNGAWTASVGPFLRTGTATIDGIRVVSTSGDRGPIWAIQRSIEVRC